MELRLSRWGVGPWIVRSALLYALLAAAATWAWPGACLLRWLPSRVAVTAGAILLALGLPLWVASAVAVMKAYNSDELVTSGVFGLSRHPLYASWILLNLPGLALLSRSWPLFLTPLVAYAVFKRLIRTEDEYLEKRFGEAYLEYRSRVNELLPIPRRSPSAGQQRNHAR